MSIDKIIEDATRDRGTMVPAVLAQQIIDSADADELHAWLRSRAQEVVASRIRVILRQGEPTLRLPSDRNQSRRAFTEAVAKGEPALVEWRQGVFKQRCIVDTSGTTKYVSDMTGDDHRFVAQHHQQSAERGAMLSAFHRQVGKMVLGSKVTGDVFSEEQLTKLANSILGHG